MSATRPPVRKLAIAIGVLIDLIVTKASIVPLVFGMMAIAKARGQSIDSSQIDGWFSDPAFLAMAFVSGALILVFAGFIAATIGSHDPVRHAAWTGVVLLAVYGVLTVIPVDAPPEPPWFTVLTLAATVPAATAGGYIRRWVQRAPLRAPEGAR